MQKLSDYYKKRESEIRNQIASKQVPITIKAAAYTCKTSNINTLKILNDLISFQTDGNTQEHEACLKYIEDYIKEVNPQSIIKRIPTNDKDNLIIGINVSKLQNIYSGIMLCGHIDVVEDKKEHFIPTISENKIYGRGCADMKSSIACFLHLIPYLNTTKTPIVLCFTCDEETNMLGIKDICAFLEENNIHPKITILGEPTNNQLGIRSTGIQSYQTIISGIAAHSSVPKKGINALFVASKIVHQLEKIAQKMQSKELYLNVGTLNGGGNIAIIPDRAQINWGFRYASKANSLKVMKQYNKIVAKTTKQYPGVSIETVQKEEFIGYTANKKRQIRVLCKKLNVTPARFSYTSEAGYLAEIGHNVYLFGVGNIASAHSNDEYVLANDMKIYEVLLLNIVTKYVNS